MRSLLFVFAALLCLPLITCEILCLKISNGIAKYRNAWDSSHGNMNQPINRTTQIEWEVWTMLSLDGERLVPSSQWLWQSNVLDGNNSVRNLIDRTPYHVDWAANEREAWFDDIWDEEISQELKVIAFSGQGETLYQRAELRLIIGKADSEKPISWEDIWRERAWKKTDWRLVLSFSVGDLFDGPLTTFKASHSSNVIVHNCSPGNT